MYLVFVLLVCHWSDLFLDRLFSTKLVFSIGQPVTKVPQLILGLSVLLLQLHLNIQTKC